MNDPHHCARLAFHSRVQIGDRIAGGKAVAVVAAALAIPRGRRS